MRLRTIDNFLDVDQKLFALSVIEDRAIPSVIDGFKPVQRKIIYIADKLWKSGNEKPMKVFQLGGQVSSFALYEHGDASMNSAIISFFARSDSLSERSISLRIRSRSESRSSTFLFF